MHENSNSVKKTANICSRISVKTHVKTVKLNYSGLLYHIQVFAIQSTMQKCRWYNNPLYFKFAVLSLHLEQQPNVKSTMENCKLDYSGLLYFVNLFPCVPYLQCSENICRVSKGEKLYVFYSILHRNVLIWCKCLHAYYLGCYILLKDDLLVCHF